LVAYIIISYEKKGMTNTLESLDSRRGLAGVDTHQKKHFDEKLTGALLLY
jgi:hypothetical protein